MSYRDELCRLLVTDHRHDRTWWLPEPPYTPVGGWLEAQGIEQAGVWPRGQAGLIANEFARARSWRGWTCELVAVEPD